MIVKTFSGRTYLCGVVLASLIVGGPSNAITHKQKPTADEQRQELQSMRQETLAEAQGYAVFSNMGMNLFVASTGNGSGIVRDNRSGKDVYMNMFSAGGGLGMGVKTFRAVFVFHTAQALEAFIESGWDFSGQADVAATTDADNQKDMGAADEALSLTQGVTVYQLTDKGLALQATLQGTKYWKDDELNYKAAVRRAE